MQTNFIVDDINKKLEIYGKSLYEDVLFKVVFSDDQTEIRKGSIDGRECTAEIQKYPWIKKKWILERWAPGEIAYHPSFVTFKNGVYVCVYVFQDVKGNYLEPIWKVCEIVVRNLLNPRKRADALCEDKEIESKQEEKEVSVIQEELEIESDKVRTQDMHSKKDSISEGYSEKELV